MVFLDFMTSLWGFWQVVIFFDIAFSVGIDEIAGGLNC